MTERKPIIVGIDFTPCSRAALLTARRLGERTGAAVRPVHIIDTLLVIELEDTFAPIARTIRGGLIEDAKKAWREFAAGDAAGMSEPDIAVNNRTFGLLRRVRELDAGLLVLGAFGQRRPDVGFGTIATACVRKSPADVLLVRDTCVGPFRRIVACVDFSETSRRALQRAAELASVEGAELRVVHVFRAPWNDLGFLASAPEYGPQSEQAMRGAMEGRLREFVAQSGDAVASAKPVCEIAPHGGHRSGIVEYAGRIGADLIVLGTRGRTNVRDILLGGTAEKVLRETACSVLAIKPVDFGGPSAPEEAEAPEISGRMEH